MYFLVNNAMVFYSLFKAQIVFFYYLLETFDRSLVSINDVYKPL